jgi:hypothetical protein
MIKQSLGETDFFAFFLTFEKDTTKLRVTFVENVKNE